MGMAWSCAGKAVLVFEDFVAETVDADGLPMFVRHAGAGPPVLLLHGHPRTSVTWHRVAPDLPGYGRSGKQAARHSWSRSMWRTATRCLLRPRGSRRS